MHSNPTFAKCINFGHSTSFEGLSEVVLGASDPDTGSIERELLELMRAEEEEK